MIHHRDMVNTCGDLKGQDDCDICWCRMTRAASRFEVGSAADNEELHADNATPDLSDSMASGAGQHHSHARTRFAAICACILLIPLLGYLHH